MKSVKILQPFVIRSLVLLLALAHGETSAQPLDEPIRPILTPQFSEKERAEIALGRSLFHDPRLSHDDTTSCASCHSLELAGADRRRVSIGINGAMGTVNAPTVINSRFNIAQFWDGRAATLEEQAAGPVHNPIEMGSNWGEVIAKLRKDEFYPARFKTLYADGISGTNIQRAIAQFERSLVTLNAPFDQYLLGDEGAISEEAKQGYRLFKSYGCVACHQGSNVGGNMYARMGAVGDYFINKQKLDSDDLGRYNVTGAEDDRHVFKVPGLRLVVHTAPYFHDGSATTLEEAVRTMARYQLGRRINAEDTQLIIRFLETLPGELPIGVPANPVAGGVGHCDRRRLGESHQGDDHSGEQQVAEPAPRQRQREGGQVGGEAAHLGSVEPGGRGDGEAGHHHEGDAREQRMQPGAQGDDDEERAGAERGLAQLGGDADEHQTGGAAAGVHEPQQPELRGLEHVLPVDVVRDGRGGGLTVRLLRLGGLGNVSGRGVLE